MWSLWTILLLSTVPPGVAGNNVPNKRPTDLERGEELYERHCVSCHGATNRGDGPATASLVHPVPDLAGKVEVGPPAVNAVLRGKGAMPTYATSFDRADARRVVMFMAQAHVPEPADDDDEAEEDAD